MGGGYYERDDSVPTNSYVNDDDIGSSSIPNTSSNMVGVTSSLNPGMDPKRWAEKKLVCNNIDPIVFALDVTGSMGSWTKIIYDKMPMFYGQIMMQKYLGDPSISFSAIGDSLYDKVPLQVSEFGQGKEIDQLISKMYLEGGGGGNTEESYELSAYFYTHQVGFTNANCPYFFLTGDEGFFSEVQSSVLEQVLGVKLEKKTYKGKDFWKELMKKYNVFFIKKEYYNDNNGTLQQWKDAVGDERILHITTPKACIDVMLVAIAITSGSRTLDEYVKDMKIREQTKERIDEVTKALKPYANLLSHRKIAPVKATNDKSLVELVKSDQDFTVVNEVTDKKLSQLEGDDLEYFKGLCKMSVSLKDEIPKELLCPITKRLFYAPVIAADGNTYERIAIETWMSNIEVSPLTGIKLDNKDLVPNLTFSKIVKNLYEKNK